MSCRDPGDQFYGLPYHEPKKETRIPPPLHIEKWNKLENATAGLSVSDDVPRPRKSSLAKPREELSSRSPKSVRFSESVNVKTIPARKLDALRGTGMDLLSIIEATDNEFASRIRKRMRPDSPAPWRRSSMAHCDTKQRGSATSRVIASTIPAMRELATEPAAPITRSLQRLRNFTRASSAAYVGTSGTATFHPARAHNSGIASRVQCKQDIVSTRGSPTPSVRSRLAFLRYIRGIRQRIASERNSTALLKRRCGSRMRTQIWPSQSVFKSLAPGRRRRTSVDGGPPRPRFYLKVSSSRQDPLLARPLSPRVKTYVEHIRDQRNPPKALQSQR